MGKPFLRGQFHQAAFFVAIGACAILITLSVVNGYGLKTILAAFVYSLSLIGLFGISALYHRLQWGDKGRMWMRRLDHSAIFILIAGTGTPLFLLGIRGDIGSKLLILVWIAAGIGILQSLFWVRAPKWVSAVLCVAVGWIVVPYLSEIKEVLGIHSVVFLLIGGIIYTLGALVYALKRPNPIPKVFGYHEIFHILVIVAAIFHFIVVFKLLTTISTGP